jgi:benzylsuccinate CoA-transferase BbsF subunit
MQKLGLAYEELIKVKPDLIMLQSSNQGQTGPQARVKGFGIHLEGLAGFTYLSGQPDKAPVVMAGLVTDWFSGHLGVCALLAALDHRRRAGEGQYIDLSQCEAGFHLLAAPFLDYTANGRVAERMGSGIPYAAPHNIYPCRGEDRWCAITVFTEEDWQRFCHAVNKDEWIEDPRFVTLLARKANEDELDRLIGEWTSKHTAEEVMDILQAKGLSAGVVKNPKDIHEDPQLKHRRHFIELEHREIGRHRYEDDGYRLSETPAESCMAAPCLGEHNYYVYTEILGMSDEEFTELLADGVFT